MLVRINTFSASQSIEGHNVSDLFRKNEEKLEQIAFEVAAS